MKFIKKIICTMVAITMCMSTACKEIDINNDLGIDKNNIVNSIDYKNLNLESCYMENSRSEINLDFISYMDSIDDEIYIFGQYNGVGFGESEDTYGDDNTSSVNNKNNEYCIVTDKNGNEKRKFNIPLAFRNDSGYTLYRINYDETISFIENNYRYENTLKFIFLNKNGEINRKLNIDIEKINEEKNFDVSDFLLTKNNDFLLFYTKNYIDYSILVVDEQGNIKKNIEKIDDKRMVSIFYNDDKCYVIYKEDNIYKLGILDIENQKIDEADVLENYNGEFVEKSDGKYLFTFFNKNNTGIWGYEKEKSSIVEVINFINSNIYIGSNYDWKCSMDKDGVYISYSYLMDSGYLTKYLPISEEKTNNKNIITIGTCQLSIENQYAIQKFNYENNDYKIYVKNYSDYVDYNDYREASKLLNYDLTNGNIPDIILFGNYYEIDSLINRGVLTDLNKFIEKDETIKKDDYLEKAFEPFEKDDKLYAFFPSFGVDTMIGFESDLGEKQGWDIDELTSFSKENKDKKLILSRDKRELIESFLSLYMDEYIDYDKKTCNFKKESFVKILELIKENNENTLFQDGILKDDNYQDMSYISELKEDVYLNKLNFYNFEFIRNLFTQYNKNKPVLKGMPSKEGNGAALLPDFTIAISEQSENKELAWEFIRTFLQDDFQNNNMEFQTITTFPIKKSYYEQDRIFKFDNSIYEYIKQISKVNIVDTNIIDIIEKEYDDFESGKKTATQVAKSTQKKVTQYLNEIKE